MGLASTISQGRVFIRTFKDFDLAIESILEDLVSWSSRPFPFFAFATLFPFLFNFYLLSLL